MSVDEVARRARAGFRRAFGGNPDGCWAAPGRVNVLGEHTDYNAGWAMPCAVPHYTVAAVARSRSPTWQVWSESADRTVTFGPSRVAETLPRSEAVEGWAGYVAGVVWALRNRFEGEVGGARIAIASDVPLGAGLSSSAALEIAALTALRDLYDLELNRWDAVFAAQSAENSYVGVPTGFLDQTASLMARQDNVLVLDCDDGRVWNVPLALEAAGMRLLAIDTRTPHRLVDDEYAARRRDCERACELLGVKSLREVKRPQTFLTLPDQVLRRRVRHVTTENSRTFAAATRLQRGDSNALTLLGSAMVQSHVSLQCDYEVSVPTLDHAVQAAMRAGAIGARMTGGGFGGSVAALVPHDKVDDVCAEVLCTAEAEDLPEPHFYDADPARGAHRLAD